MVLHCYKARESHLFVISNRGDWDQTWTSINHFMLEYVVDSTSLPLTALVSIFFSESTDSSVGRASDSSSQGRGFDPHLGRGVVSLSKTLHHHC